MTYTDLYLSDSKEQEKKDGTNELKEYDDGALLDIHLPQHISVYLITILVMLIKNNVQTDS